MYNLHKTFTSLFGKNFGKQKKSRIENQNDQLPNKISFGHLLHNMSSISKLYFKVHLIVYVVNNVYFFKNNFRSYTCHSNQIFYFKLSFAEKSAVKTKKQRKSYSNV